MTRRIGLLIGLAALAAGCQHGAAGLVSRRPAPAPPPAAQVAAAPAPAARSSYHVVADPPPLPPAPPQPAPVAPARHTEPPAKDPQPGPALPPPPPPAPTPPAPAPAPPPDAPPVAAFRCLLRSEPAAAAEHLRALDPARRELTLQLLGLAAKAAQPDHDPTALVEPLDTLTASLRARAPLVLDRLCFCRRIEGFGAYEPLPPGYTFQAGRDGLPGERVQVYVEVANFLSRPCPAGYETGLGITLQIHDYNQQVVCTLHPQMPPDRSRTPRRDCFINCSFHVPPKLPAGDYTLWVEVKDHLAPAGAPPRVARRSLDFKVGGAGR